MRSTHPQIQYIKVAKLPARDTAVWWVRTVRNMSASLSSLVLLLSLSYFRASGSGFHWDYSLSGTNGPQYWKNHYPSCGLTRQSPIDLVEKVAQHDDDLSPILFRNYDTQLSVTMELLNNGHTAEVKLTQGALSISGGHLGHDYVALQFHFHWGSSSDRGSEHHLNGKASPMELHIVHRNKKYNSTDMALKDVEGLAVLGFFFNVVQTRNTKLDVIINHLKEIRFNGNKTNITAFPLMDILPDESNLKDYFRYDGSLTTPPCSQAVIWTVFRTPIEISEKQLVELRSLKSGTSSSSKSISNNYRPIQRLEMRDLKTSFKPLGHPWSYKDPDHWTDEYSMCKGIRQSPINIDRESVEFDKNLEQFTFHGYSSGSLNMTLENNGHTAKVSLQGEINVSGGDLPMVYKAVQFHFHWGSRSFKGSEHTYDKKTYPMEMHIVHYAAIFDSFTDAAKYADGLAVLAFMFRLSRVDNPAFNKITDYLNQTEERNNCVDITPFPIDSLLPKEKASYFRYRGSLTTPPCSETVIWTVFAEPILISEKQLNHFRALKANSVQHLVDNFRPVQNLFNRKITKNFMSNPIGSTTALIPTVLPLYFFPVVALCVRI